MVKRILDLVSSVVGLVVLAPLLLLAALWVRLSSPGPALFKQSRIGRGFRPFTIYKLRTMVQEAPNRGGVITVGDDPRITRVGRLLRKSKIDELPQLFNVVLGHMSLVGPRPESEKYVHMFHDDYSTILQVRPGITDLASIKYRDEAALLARAENPEDEYIRRVLPEKIRLAKEYIREQSLWFDLKIILSTVAALFRDRISPRSAVENQQLQTLSEQLDLSGEPRS